MSGIDQFQAMELAKRSSFLVQILTIAVCFSFANDSDGDGDDGE
jgi:hypothetical protein